MQEGHSKCGHTKGTFPVSEQQLLVEDSSTEGCWVGVGDYWSSCYYEGGRVLYRLLWSKKLLLVTYEYCFKLNALLCSVLELFQNSLGYL